MIDSASPRQFSPRIEQLESRTVLSVDAFLASGSLDFAAAESHAAAESANVSLEANPVETLPLNPAAETDLTASDPTESPRDLVRQLIVVKTVAAQVSPRLEIDGEASDSGSLQSNNVLIQSTNTGTRSSENSLVSARIDPSLPVHIAKAFDGETASRAYYVKALLLGGNLATMDEFRLIHAYRQTIGDETASSENVDLGISNARGFGNATEIETLHFTLRIEHSDAATPHMQARELRNERIETRGQSQTIWLIDFSDAQNDDEPVLTEDHRINRLVPREILFDECIETCSEKPESVFVVGVWSEKSEAVLVGADLLANTAASGSIPVVVTPITSELLPESSAAQSNDITHYGMPGIAAPATASALDAALLNFLEQIDDIGREITETLAANAWLTWAVAAGIGWISFDMARKKYRRFRSQVHGRHDESDSLSWFPGLPGPFSTQVT